LFKAAASFAFAAANLSSLAFLAASAASFAALTLASTLAFSAAF